MKFRRKKGQRESYKIYLACEGTITEPTYFQKVGIHLRTRKFEIVIVERETNENNPDKLLKKLLELKNSRKVRKDDLLFLVCDRDDCAKENLDKVAQTCNANNVVFSVSNPCFEFWLLLHCENYDLKKELDNCQTVKKLLVDQFGGYKKSNPCDSETLKGLSKAVERANKLDDPDELWPQSNGSRVYHIIEKLQDSWH